MTVMEKYKWELTRSLLFAAIIMALTVVTHLIAPPNEIPSLKNARHTPSAPPEASAFSASSVPSVSPVSSASPVSPISPVRRPHRHPIQPATTRAIPAPPPSDPRVFSVGPNDIANRYTLLAVERKQSSPSTDQLIIRLHIESLAMNPFVSPFESDMLEINSPGLPPINPSTPFKRPLASGSSRNQEIAFDLPADFPLHEATLRIHYYMYEHEVPLKLLE